MSLTVAPCSHEAAKYAVLRWHYSARMPKGRLARYGVWEEAGFIGAVLFGHGANHNLGSRLSLSQTECCELVRVALRSHRDPVSRIVALALRRLKADSPGLRLVLSYADPNQGHLGTIYQAGNWLYLGRSSSHPIARIDGRWVHQRHWSRWSEADRAVMVKRPREAKYRYAYPLDRGMRRRLESLALPYPEKVSTSAP